MCRQGGGGNGGWMGLNNFPNLKEEVSKLLDNTNVWLSLRLLKKKVFELLLTGYIVT